MSTSQAAYLAREVVTVIAFLDKIPSQRCEGDKHIFSCEDVGTHIILVKHYNNDSTNQRSDSSPLQWSIVRRMGL
jgi:hypothetical protein